MIESFGKYRVIERIGEGGFGQVYRGWDGLLSRDVAIKTVTMTAEQARERFLREAEIAAGLRHSAIVTIYDFGEQDGVPYLVQEYLPGEDVGSLIARGEAGELATRVQWLRQVAQGLHYAHARGIIHRDVKPANIRVLEDGTVRIMDFGIAKALDATSRLTGTNVSLGTSGYVAPEQLEGRPIDGRADMFAFGVMAYELVTYERPFEAETVSATLYRILTADPVPVLQLAPDTPPRLAACIERCLRKRREERFADMAEVDAELSVVLEEIEAGPASGVKSGARAVAPAQPVQSTAIGSPAGSPEPAPRDATPTREPQPMPAPAESGPLGTGRQKAVIVVAALLILAMTGWAAVAALSAVRGARDGAEPGRLDSAVPGNEAPLATADSLNAADGRGTRALPGDSAVILSAGDPAAADPSAGEETADPRSASDGGHEPARSGDGPAGTGAASPTGDRAGEGAVTRSAQATQSAAVSPSSPSPGAPIDANKVLVLISGGRQDAVMSAQNVVLSQLLAAGRPVVDPDAVDAIRADAAAIEALEAGASPAAGIGRAYGAGIVVVADLSTDAAPAPGGFVTGTAVLTARFHDARTGELLLAETYRVGAGGTAARPGTTETAAVTQASEAVARQLVRAILTRTGG